MGFAIIIETKRLILRPFEERDAKDIFEYLEYPEPHCFYCMKINDLEEAKKEAIKRSEDKDYYFAITLKETGKVIGEIDAYPEPADPDGPFTAKDTFSPCWMLNKAYQGKGYAYEAAVAFFEYLFNKKGARRIYAYTEDYNIKSQALCKKLGMRQEALYKEFISFVNNPDGTPLYENTYEFAILKKEWQK